MFGLGTHEFVDSQARYYLSTNLLLLIVLVICSTPIPAKALSYLREKLRLAGVLAVPAVHIGLVLLSTAYLVNDTYNPFLYFRF
jgi:alginate O-acetyltransferase complex protein AlgI